VYSSPTRHIKKHSIEFSDTQWDKVEIILKKGLFMNGIIQYTMSWNGSVASFLYHPDNDGNLESYVFTLLELTNDSEVYHKAATQLLFLCYHNKRNNFIYKHLVFFNQPATGHGGDSDFHVMALVTSYFFHCSFVAIRERKSNTSMCNRSSEHGMVES